MSRFNTEQSPHGGWLIRDGSREVGWMQSRDDALYVARKLEQRCGAPAHFSRAEEDRLDYAEQGVTYLTNARTQ